MRATIIINKRKDIQAQRRRDDRQTNDNEKNSYMKSALKIEGDRETERQMYRHKNTRET